MPIITKDGEIIDREPLRTPRNYATSHASDETATYNNEPTKTQQSFRDETDINHIIDKFGVENVAQNPRQMPSSSDFYETFDYQTAQNTIRQAHEAFMDQPAHIRAEFDNDPGKFIKFLEDPDNQDKAIKLGLATKRTEPQKENNPAEEPGKETPK